MRTSAAALLFSCLFLSSSFSADLTTCKETYEKKLGDIAVEHGINMAALADAYAKALKQVQEVAQKAGDLEKTKAALAEMERFARDKRVTESLAKDSTPEIKKVQLAYITDMGGLELSRARRVVTLSEQYDKALEALQRDLTRQGKLDDASNVSDERKSSTASPEVMSARAALQAKAKAPSAPAPTTPVADKGAAPVQAAVVEIGKPIVIEAVKYSKKTRKNDHEWEPQKKGRILPAYLRSMPSSNMVIDPNRAKIETASPMVGYDVQFKEAGTYYVWMLGIAGMGDGGCYFGLDGACARNQPIMGFNLAGKPTWSNQQVQVGKATLEIANPGKHTVNVWMGEDGFGFAKIILTKDPDYNPTDTE